MSYPAGKAFLEASLQSKIVDTAAQKGESHPPIEFEPPEIICEIDLPPQIGARLETENLRALIEQRRSLRTFSGKPLSLDEFAWLLWATQGVQNIIERNNMRITIRTSPSAGARHPFDTYILVNNVTDLEPGLYLYKALTHKLAKLPAPSGIAETLVEGCLNQKFLFNANAVFFWAATIARIDWRYGPRSYRYVFLDAGHVCQNLYLASEAIGAGVCGIGAYDDDKVNQALGLDGDHRFVAYAATVGKKPE